jgi:hypothetical protein
MSRLGCVHAFRHTPPKRRFEPDSPTPAAFRRNRLHRHGSSMLAERLQRERIPTLAGHHLHGKEGSTVRVRQRACKSPGNRAKVLPATAKITRFAGTRRVHFGTGGIRGHARRLATKSGTCPRHSIAATHSKDSCKQAVGVARAGVCAAESIAPLGIVLRRDADKRSL